MNSIEGIYRLEILSPYGWENFSTVFIEHGQFKSAAADHCITGHYDIRDNFFNAQGIFNQYSDKLTIFGLTNQQMKSVIFQGWCQGSDIRGSFFTSGREQFKVTFQLSRILFDHDRQDTTKLNLSEHHDPLIALSNDTPQAEHSLINSLPHRMPTTFALD